jgi:hypothetical protein
VTPWIEWAVSSDPTNADVGTDDSAVTTAPPVSDPSDLETEVVVMTVDAFQSLDDGTLAGRAGCDESDLGRMR